MKKKVSILLGILLCLFHIMADTEAATAQTKSQAIKTNKDKVITIAIQGKIAPAQPSSLYITTWEGKLKMAIGVGGINYNLKIGDKVFGWASTDKATVGVAAEGTGGDRYTVSVGDSTYGWASTDHVEPDVTFQGRDNPSPGRCAVAILVCIGNEAEVISGEAKGTKGVYLGRHAGSDDLSGNSRKIWTKKTQTWGCGGHQRPL